MALLEHVVKKNKLKEAPIRKEKLKIIYFSDEILCLEILKKYTHIPLRTLKKIKNLPKLQGKRNQYTKIICVSLH